VQLSWQAPPAVQLVRQSSRLTHEVFVAQALRTVQQPFGLGFLRQVVQAVSLAAGSHPGGVPVAPPVPLAPPAPLAPAAPLVPIGGQDALQAVSLQRK
jgi:hypothetical protein